MMDMKASNLLSSRKFESLGRRFSKRKKRIRKGKLKEDIAEIDPEAGTEGLKLEELRALKKDLVAKGKLKKDIAEIDPEAGTEGLDQTELKELKKGLIKVKKQREEKSQQKKWSEIAMKYMIPKIRYGKKEIIELIQENYDGFTDEELSENISETNPKWHRWLGNALRCTPDTDSTNQNWWIELRAVKEGRRLRYYIEE